MLNGTSFSDLFRAFRVVVSGITGYAQVLAHIMYTVPELVRRGVMNQYPGLMPTLYPGELATAPAPFGSVDAMWSAFQVLATNKTPVIRDEKYFRCSFGGPLFAIACRQSVTEQTCLPVVSR